MKSVACYHVERTGGTSLLASLDRAGIPWAAHHKPYDDLEGDVRVTFLREPRSRLVSEFVLYWNLAHHGGKPIVAKTLLDYVLCSLPAYGHVPQMHFVGVFEDYSESLHELGDLLGAVLREREDNRHVAWTPFSVGGSLDDLRRALDWTCLPDLQTYCRVAGDRVPDTNEMLEYTLDKLRVAERAVLA